MIKEYQDKLLTELLDKISVCISCHDYKEIDALAKAYQQLKLTFT